MRKTPLLYLGSATTDSSSAVGRVRDLSVIVPSLIMVLFFVSFASAPILPLLYSSQTLRYSAFLAHADL